MTDYETKTLLLGNSPLYRPTRAGDDWIRGLGGSRLGSAIQVMLC
jgi:hypothetical protein